MRLSATALIALAVAFEGAQVGAQVRDSAGIQIVENSIARVGDRVPFRVSERPTLQIGVESGDPNHQFTEIAAATRLADGSLVIADRRSGEIRIFDASGAFLRKFGRKGQGAW